MSRAQWTARRKARFAREGNVKVTAQEVAVRMTGAGTATTRFRQAYQSADFSDTTDKTLDWVRVDSKWLIQRERNR